MTDKKRTDYEDREDGFLGYPLAYKQSPLRRSTFEPWYDDKKDYNTNAPSYYDYLGRMHKLIQLLADRIWEYDKELAKRFEEWDKLIEKFPENVENLLIEWLEDGTLDDIINKNIFKDLNEKIDKAIKQMELLKQKTIDSQDILLSNLDKITPIGTVNTRSSVGDTKFPQSSSINQEKGVFYILRQTTGEITDQTLYEYDLEDSHLIRKKVIPFETDAYIEGLVFRNNIRGETEFIIPLGRQGGSYVVYNFDTNYVSGTIKTEMSNKNGFDNNRNYFISIKTDKPNMNPNYYTTGVNIYKLNSMFNQVPEFVRSVYFMREIVVGDYKIQSLGMINDVIFLTQGSDDVLTTAIDLEGNVLKRISYDKQSLSIGLGLAKHGINQDNIFEPQSTSFIKENGIYYLVELITSQGRAVLAKHGISNINDNKLYKVKTKSIESYNPSKYLDETAPMKIMRRNGTPTYQLSPEDDLFKEIENIEKGGAYTIVVSSSAKNTPYGASTLTGWVYARSVSSETGKISRAVVELTDISNRKFSTTYDINRSKKWFNWEQNSGLYVNLKDNRKLSSLNMSGKYYLSADMSRKISDVPESYKSLPTLIVNEPITQEFTIQKAFRLNNDTGYSNPAYRTLFNGKPAKESDNTDNYGWKHI